MIAWKQFISLIYLSLVSQNSNAFLLSACSAISSHICMRMARAGLPGELVPYNFITNQIVIHNRCRNTKSCLQSERAHTAWCWSAETLNPTPSWPSKNLSNAMMRSIPRKQPCERWRFWRWPTTRISLSSRKLSERRASSISYSSMFRTISFKSYRKRRTDSRCRSFAGSSTNCSRGFTTSMLRTLCIAISSLKTSSLARITSSRSVTSASRGSSNSREKRTLLTMLRPDGTAHLSCWWEVSMAKK